MGRVGQPTLALLDRILRGPDSRLILTQGRFTETFRLGTCDTREDIYIELAKLAFAAVGKAFLSTD